MPCDTCGTPIAIHDTPVVIEWGKKEPNQPSFLGRPWKRVRCHNCDRQLSGRKTKEHKEPAPGKEPKRTGVFPKKESTAKASAGKLVGKIYLLVKDNPRKPGTHGFQSFNLVKPGMTVEAYLAAGGRANDLRWDIDHGWAEVK